MSKLKILAGTVLLVLGCFNIGYAAGLGPMRPLGNMKACLSVEDDFIFKRVTKAKVDIETAEAKNANHTFALLGLGISDYLNAYARLGAGNLNERINWIGNFEDTVKYQYGFMWGAGVNASYALKNNFGFGVDAQFNMGSNKAKSIKGDDNPDLTGKGPIKSYEIQVAPYVKYDVKINEKVKILPYAGGYYSLYKVRRGITFTDDYGDCTTEDEKLRSKYRYGPLVGAEVSFLDHLNLKVEGRFVAETALSTSLSYKF